VAVVVETKLLAVQDSEMVYQVVQAVVVALMELAEAHPLAVKATLVVMVLTAVLIVAAVAAAVHLP
jgi:hypothetical protein